MSIIGKDKAVLRQTISQIIHTPCVMSTRIKTKTKYIGSGTYSELYVGLEIFVSDLAPV